MSDLDPPGTFRRYVWDELSTNVLRGHFGRRLAGVFSLFADTFMEAVTQSVRVHWVADNPPPDAVALAGAELSIERYATDTDETYHARVLRAWEDWEFAGAESAIIAQLAVAGFPGAQIVRWSGGGSWSEFLVFFPEGTHSVISEGPQIGSFTVGDGTVIGPEGITPAQLATIRRIVKAWRPARWVCAEIVWELSGWTIGTGHTIGEADLVIGGTQARTKGFVG